MTAIKHLDGTPHALPDAAPAKPARVRKTVSAADPSPSDHAAPHKPANKIATVIELLCRQDGATLAEMVEATGWLPHTTRAALTGLRKKGHAIERGSRDEVSVYTIKAAG